jgi:hypothetical protein
MSNTKVLGIVAATAIGGVDYQLSKFTAKTEQEKIEYKYLGAVGAWKRCIAGGAKCITGSFEAAADSTTIQSTGSTTFVAPFQDQSTVSFSIPCGGHTLSFSAVITDVDLDVTTELVTIKGNYQSDGAVTFT